MVAFQQTHSQTAQSLSEETSLKVTWQQDQPLKLDPHHQPVELLNKLQTFPSHQFQLWCWWISRTQMSAVLFHQRLVPFMQNLETLSISRTWMSRLELLMWLLMPEAESQLETCFWSQMVIFTSMQTEEKLVLVSLLTKLEEGVLLYPRTVLDQLHMVHTRFPLSENFKFRNFNQTKNTFNN